MRLNSIKNVMSTTPLEVVSSYSEPKLQMCEIVQRDMIVNIEYM